MEGHRRQRAPAGLLVILNYVRHGRRAACDSALVTNLHI
jgi:hypothetical protein